jgi:hypothetical protein
MRARHRPVCACASASWRRPRQCPRRVGSG